MWYLTEQVYKTYDVRSESLRMDRDRLIQQYFTMGLSHAEIQTILALRPL